MSNAEIHRLFLAAHLDPVNNDVVTLAVLTRHNLGMPA
jgi:hypothetical protein